MFTHYTSAKSVVSYNSGYRRFDSYNSGYRCLGLIGWKLEGVPQTPLTLQYLIGRRGPMLLYVGEIQTGGADWAIVPKGIKEHGCVD